MALYDTSQRVMGSRIEQYYSSRHASGHEKSVENKHLHALKVRQ